MDNNAILQAAQTLAQSLVERIEQPESNRLDLYMAPEGLLPASTALLQHGYYLSAITGLDVPPTDSTEGQIELLYHYCLKAVVVSLRIQLPYGNPVVPTLCNLIPSATLYERELIEMFGVTITGTPSTDRLLLSDDWPEDIYPLRKSFIVKD